MNYENYKARVAEEEGWCDEKQARKTIINLILFTVGLVFLFAVPVVPLLGFGVMVAVFLVLIVLAKFILDYSLESKEAFKTVNKVVKLWILPLIGSVVVYIVMRFTGFY